MARAMTNKVVLEEANATPNVNVWTDEAAANQMQVLEWQTHTAQRLDFNQLCGSFSEPRTAIGLAASANQELQLA